MEHTVPDTKRPLVIVNDPDTLELSKDMSPFLVINSFAIVLSSLSDNGITINIHRLN